MIINFVSGGDNGGVKQCFLHYQKALQDAGYGTIATVRSNFPALDQLKQLTLDYQVSSYIRSDISIIREYSIRKLKNFFAHIQPDIVIVHKNIDIKLVKLAVGPKTKVIGVMHGYNNSYCEYADALIAVSQGVQHYIQKNTTKPIFLLYNPVDLFSPEPQSFFMHKTPVLGTMALFKRKKRIGDLIKATRILKDWQVPCKVLIAGKRKRLELFYKIQSILNNTSKIIDFQPWVKDKIKFFDDIDIFCLNSSSESFGMVLTEAMARKKIVISTDCDGPREIITDKVNGFLVERNNPQAFAAIIKDILDNKYDLTSITENGFIRAKELSINNFQQNLSNIITQLQKL